MGLSTCRIDAVRDDPQPLEYPTGAVLLPAFETVLHARVGADRSRPAVKPAAPHGCSEASRPGGERSPRPRPAFPYGSVPAGTHEPDSEDHIPAPSSDSSRLVVGRTP